MREHPILFSAPMVRAILDGRKTETRRVIVPQPEFRDGAWYWSSPRYDNGDGVHYFHTKELTGAMEQWGKASPYGVAGDRLWVRETWWHRRSDGVIAYAVDGHLSFDKTSLAHKMGIHNTPCKLATDDEMRAWGFVKRPSIFMPRWASRLTLELTQVRVERLQEITDADIRAEGFDCPTHDFPGGMCVSECPDLRRAFRELWNKLNAKRGFGWDTDPWVWVLIFRKMEGKPCSQS